ncbi:PIG-L family deacetylase [Phormidium yuhuli AB48]|uniref:PIG-L family deacetylase n=1 Tax=Phormidium yuhuli AB48 TaxID=2940671 RepID=A0ABY5AL48_9CYAN|nr:PIG-L deacetylase family protein [Phormidium yuhuli]USR89924.1 PIG-L family deacetylase [Phormidium yuhuli AB48]
MSQKTLIIAAHPDDEVLGCGGTIAAQTSQGTSVQVMFLADGVSSRGGEASAELQRRHHAAHTAAELLGIESVSFADFPDNQLDTVPLLRIVQRIEDRITQYQPDTILTHHAGDVNIDHQRVHQAVITACRPQPGHPVKTLLLFEVPSSTEWQPPGSAAAFLPNWFIDISDTLEGKLEALAAYGEELRDFPHPRSVEAVKALARWRGATVGVRAAEAFVLGRRIG